MQNTTALYKSIISGPYSCDVKLAIYDGEGTLVGEWGMDKLFGLTTEQGMIKDDTLLIGNCIAGTINVSILPTDSNGDVVTIPRMAKLVPFVKVYNDTDESEWIKKGEFFIDTRATTAVSGVMELTGYDAMLKAEMDYPSDDVSEYPKTDIDIVDFLADAIGVDVDDRTYDVINAEYEIGLPIGYSCREVLSGIATMYGANFVITDEGKLRAIGVDELRGGVEYLVDENSAVLLIGGVAINVWHPSIAVGADVMQLESSSAYEGISKVTVFLDDNNYIISGDDTGAELECSSPFATQEIADDLLGRMAGYTYQPFDASGVFLDPAAEIGDGIEVGGVASSIFNASTTFGALYFADITAPTTKEIDHEYPYKAKSDRQYERRMAEVGSRISQTASAIEAEVTARTEADGNISTLLTQTASDITFRFDSDFNDLHKYIRYADGNITLGEEANAFKAILSSTKLSFKEGDNELAYAANNQFRMPYGVVENTLDLGGYQLDATDGIKFRWKGREVE